ncbi:MAG TPA: hypothetical protein VFN22_05470 [Gemmatimonadales bacterium]|nr:hypothetical protein [Gemmatimonadales bacterium]
MIQTRSAIPLTLLLAACSGSGAGSDGARASAPLQPTVHDSSGVTIYEHPADALARAPLLTLDSTPLAVFAGDLNDPSLDVSALTWPIFLESGDLAGYDRQARQILVLRAATGARVRRGRAGSGPLEIGFAGPFVALQDDSLIFDDFQNDRWAIAHPDTGVVRTIAKNAVEGLRSSRLIGRDGGGDGTYLLTVPGQALQGPPPTGRVNSPQYIGTWVIGDDSVHARFSVPTGPRVWVKIGDGIAQYRLGLAPSTSLGRWGDGFLVARGERWTLERWDTGGRLQSEVRLDRPSVLVDDAMFERSVQSETDEMVRAFVAAGRPANADSILVAIRSRGYADTLAAHGSVFVSPNGTIWVTDFIMPGDSGWAATAVARDGRILGRIIEPNGKLPIAWGDDRVAIETEDALGIATITIRKVRGL